MIVTIKLKNSHKYDISKKVRTKFGKGKITNIKPEYIDGKIVYFYKIKYNLFKKIWCREDTILEEIE